MPKKSLAIVLVVQKNAFLENLKKAALVFYTKTFADTGSWSAPLERT